MHDLHELPGTGGFRVHFRLREPDGVETCAPCPALPCPALPVRKKRKPTHCDSGCSTLAYAGTGSAPRGAATCRTASGRCMRSRSSRRKQAQPTPCCAAHTQALAEGVALGSRQDRRVCAALPQGVGRGRRPHRTRDRHPPSRLHAAVSPWRPPPALPLCCRPLGTFDPPRPDGA